MKRPHSRIFAVVLLVITFVSCSPPAYRERGLGSYIADQYAGRRTSSGEVYQPYAWTAAHQSLPFGTQVKVKNHHNGRAVNLTINDRFPYYPSRIINVSRAAAEYLQIPPYQMADVTVTAKTLPGGYGAPPAQYSAPPTNNYAAPPANYSAQPQPLPQPNFSTPPPQLTPPPPLSPPPPGYGTQNAR